MEWHFTVIGCHAQVSKGTRWVKPNSGNIVLNTDGCSKGSPGQNGGGGILGDANGKCWLHMLVTWDP